MMSLISWYRRHSWIGRAVQLAAGLGALGFLLRSLVANWQILRAYDWQIDAARSGLAVSCLVAAFGLLPLVSRRALTGLGEFVSYRTSYYGYFMGQLAKYLPGGIWILPGRAAALGGRGVNAFSSITGVVIEMLLLLFSGGLVFLPYSLAGGSQLGGRGWLLTLLLVPILMLGLHPRIMNPILRWLFALAGRADQRIDLSVTQLVGLLLIDIVFWLVAGTGLFFLVSSVHPVSWRLWLVLPPALSASWAAGMLAFVMPAGLGVREGALTWLLSPFLPAPLPLGIALLARVWWTAAELISIGIAGLAMGTPAGRLGVDE